VQLEALDVDRLEQPFSHLPVSTSKGENDFTPVHSFHNYLIFLKNFDVPLFRLREFSLRLFHLTEVRKHQLKEENPCSVDLWSSQVHQQSLL
jgi:hypothetical protein